MPTPTPSYTIISITEPGAEFTVGYAINDLGEVVGNYDDSGGSHGFIDDNGSVITLNAAAAGFTIADAINNRGEVAGYYIDSTGYHGYVYDNGALTTLNVPVATATLAEAINDCGEVAGYCADSSGGHGYVYDNFQRGGIASHRRARRPCHQNCPAVMDATEPTSSA